MGGITPPGSPRSHDPVGGPASPRGTGSHESDKAGEVAKAALSGTSSPSHVSDRAPHATSGTSDLIEDMTNGLGVLGTTTEDLLSSGEKIDMAHTKLKSAPLSPRMQSLLNNIHTALKKLWSAGIAPLLAGIATGGNIATQALTAAIVYCFVLPVVACAQIYWFVAEKMGDTDAAEAQKLIKQGLNNALLTTLITFSSEGLKGDYDYFKNILTGMSAEEASQTLNNLKADLGLALLETYGLEISIKEYNKLRGY